MRQAIKIFVVAHLLMLGLGIAAIPVHAATSGPASVELQVPIQTYVNGKPVLLENVSYFATYLNAFFAFAFGILISLAIIRIMMAGITWITSGGDSGKIAHAKKDLVQYLTGLALAILTYSILYTINPDLVKLSMISPKVPGDGATACTADSTDPTCIANQVCCFVKKDTQAFLFTKIDSTDCTASGGTVHSGGRCSKDGASLLPCDAQGNCSQAEYCNTEKFCVPRLAIGQLCENKVSQQIESSAYSKEIKKVCIEGSVCAKVSTSEPMKCGAKCSTTQPCATGQVCSQQTGTCTEGFINNICTNNDDTQCAKGLVCNTAFRNTCAYPGQDGNVCDEDADCAHGYICDTVGLNVCKKPTEQKAFCNKMNECGPNACDCVGETALTPGVCTYEITGKCQSCESPGDPRCQ